ncbi:MAG: molybdate ABC transporter substrate-binding protein [Jatrophihabitans sp.]
MKRVLSVLVAGSMLFAAGCSSSGAGGKSSAPGSSTHASSDNTAAQVVNGTITVLAAASLTGAFTTIKAQFEAKYPGVTVVFDFGASSELSTQIDQGKPADVFASASTKNMAAVTKAGNAPSPTNFVKNTLEIAVPPKNPGTITSVNDLAKSGVKVAVCDAAVPCGVVAQKVFDNAKITVKPVARPQDVKATLALVESGEVDAGLVYVTDVRAAGAKVKGVVIPANVNASTTYPIATLAKSANPKTAAMFVDFVLSPAGQAVLKADGFSQP